MKSFFNQRIILLTYTTLLCFSQQCSNNQVYTDNERPSSCKHILANYPATPSGYYWLQSSADHFTSHKVYCDMDNERCGSKGWTRIALVDMSDRSQSCPGNLTLIGSPIRTCGGPPNGGCASAKFSTHGMSYSKVCGIYRLRGYQIGQPGAFGPYVNDPTSGVIIDGVLISHGKIQKHIWAYATGFERVPTDSGYNNHFCPCASYKFNGTVPPFIGNDYYCDSGVDNGPEFGKFYTTPLWTGEGCTPPNFCCSHSGMPWFCKTLPVSTTDYIEIRNCHSNKASNEDTALELIELYIY